MNQFKELLQKQKKKITPEQDLRKTHLELARQYGFEDELRTIWSRYDSLIKQSKSEQEHEQIAIMGLCEVHKLLGCTGPLVVNGKEIIPAKPGYKPEE